jgi:hypothetical protein
LVSPSRGREIIGPPSRGREIIGPPIKGEGNNWSPSRVKNFSTSKVKGKV